MAGQLGLIGRLSEPCPLLEQLGDPTVQLGAQVGIEPIVHQLSIVFGGEVDQQLALVHPLGDHPALEKAAQQGG